MIWWRVALMIQRSLPVLNNQEVHVDDTPMKSNVYTTPCKTRLIAGSHKYLKYH